MGGGIDGDPEGLFRVADKVLGEPAGYMNRARTTIQTVCGLPWDAFGVAPGAAFHSDYNSTQQAFVDATGTAATLINGMAAGLANVAHVYGSAEDANTLMAPAVSLSSRHLDPVGSTTPASTREIATVAIEIWFDVFFLAAHGVLKACAELTPAAIAATISWALITPNRAEISTAVNGWGAAKLDVNSAKDALDGIVPSDIDKVWTVQDSARSSFDSWWGAFDLDLDQLKDAVDQMHDKLQDMLQELQTIHYTMLVAACSALAALIALTAFDWAFAAPEAAKAGVGAGIDIDVVATVGGLCAVVIAFVGSMVDLGSKAGGFNVNTPGNQAMPHFEDDTINWDPGIKP